ncbi:pentapeptide repeat-containing protein [Actinomadura logoneensis]|nr:pentapeptide repeat-containing protein [Actinomadura logoneensis]
MIGGIAVAAMVLWVLGPGAKWWLVHVDGVKVGGQGGLGGKDLAEALDRVRGRAMAVGTGLLAVVAIYYTASNAASARRSAQAAIDSVEAARRTAETTEAAQRRTFELTEQGQHRSHELTELGQRTDRFTAAVEQLGSSSPAIRLGGVYALAGLADDSPTPEFRQTCIDVLCAFLRLPYDRHPGVGREHEQARKEFRAAREVRHTVLRIIGDHLRDDAAVSWRGHNLDFTDVVFDGGDFRQAVFDGGNVSFREASFLYGTTLFTHARFVNGSVTFEGARFGGGRVDFQGVRFDSDVVSFEGAEFGDGVVDFAGAAGRRPEGLPDELAPQLLPAG